MAEKFTIEDEHRPGGGAYRLLAGARVIARDVSAEFVHLLANADELRDALYAILYADQDNHIPNDLHAQAFAALNDARANQPEVIGFV